MASQVLVKLKKCMARRSRALACVTTKRQIYPADKVSACVLRNTVAVRSHPEQEPAHLGVAHGDRSVWAQCLVLVVGSPAVHHIAQPGSKRHGRRRACDPHAPQSRRAQRVVYTVVVMNRYSSQRTEIVQASPSKKPPPLAKVRTSSHKRVSWSTRGGIMI
jgi:hypothetical protein